MNDDPLRPPGLPAGGALLRAAIDGVAFRDLVAGRVARLKTRYTGAELAIEVILSDIGFEEMLDAVAAAMQDHRAPGGD